MRRLGPTVALYTSTAPLLLVNLAGLAAVVALLPVLFVADWLCPPRHRGSS